MADRWERVAPWTGIVFVLLFLLLLFFPGEEIPADATAEQITATYEEQGRTRPAAEFFLFGLAAASLLWFAGVLRTHLRRAEGDPGRLSAVAFGGGAASASLIMVAAAQFVAPAGAVAFADQETLLIDPALNEVMGGAGYLTFNYGLIAAAVMIAAASLVALRAGALPAWFGWAGFLVALALVPNALYFFGFFAFLAWVLVASIILLLRLRAAPAGAG